MADLTPDHELENEEFDAATRERQPRNWQRIGAITAAVIIGLVIILFGARWIYHQSKHKSVNKPAAAATSQKLSSPSSTSQNGKTPASNTPTQTSTPPATGSQVPNTGPGSTLAIFLGASFVAASLHHVITRRSQR